MHFVYVKESWALILNRKQCNIYFGENTLRNCISRNFSNMSTSKFTKREKGSWRITVLSFLWCFPFSSLVIDMEECTYSLQIFYSYVDVRGKDRLWQTDDLLQVLNCAQCSLSSWCDDMKWPPSSCPYSPFPTYRWRTVQAYLMLLRPLPCRILFSSRLVVSLNVLEALCSNHIHKYTGVQRK